jgi:hypothetical protein
MKNITTLAPRIQRLLTCDALRFRRLWAYYRNPILATSTGEGAISDRPYRQAMEWGLPSRITGVRSSVEVGAGTRVDEIQRKEVVIENDIAWRIDTQVDYLFGKSIVLSSIAPDPSRRELISALLRQILANAGGITFLQQLALLGAVYGFVDVLVKLAPEDEAPTLDCSHHAHDLGARSTAETTEPPPPESANALDDSTDTGASHPSLKAVDALARRIRLEIIEPSRALPVLACDNWKKVEAYAQVWEEKGHGARGVGQGEDHRASGWFERIRSILSPHLAVVRSTTGSVTGFHDEIPDNVHTELITREKWYRFKGSSLIDSGDNALNEIPLIHIQNTPLPFEYAGESEVEPLIPIQDEINTRLSDRGYRITMQSFKMFLGIGIDNFLETPVSPGRMWVTDNEKAKVLEFGGDGKTFSEDNQIAEMREAMDKISGVTPIAAGVTRRRIGRLTSAAALKVTMLALLAKTERKRTMYGNGIARLCELALAWLDKANLFHTTPEERQIEIHWPNPLPVNELERLEEAQAKLRIGVSREVVLKELGYSPSSPAGEGRGEG